MRQGHIESERYLSGETVFKGRIVNVRVDSVELLKGGSEHIVCPYMGDSREWTRELRNKEAAVLKEVLTLEREALELIETIMEVCEIEPYKAPDRPREARAP